MKAVDIIDLAMQSLISEINMHIDTRPDTLLI
jgi:hypothetical protein